MYIIIEGMPSSGKTSVAKTLVQNYNATYFKSLLPNDSFGDRIRDLRDSRKRETESTLFHVIDLFRNELQIRRLISDGEHVVRDKCFISSLAHVLSVENESSEEVRQLLLNSYEELAKQMLMPDKFIFLDRSLEFSREISGHKDDKSVMDSIILDDTGRFENQKHQLKLLAEKYFADRMILVSGTDTMENDIKKIIERIDTI